MSGCVAWARRRTGLTLLAAMLASGCGPASGTVGDFEPARSSVLAMASDVLVPLPDGRLVVRIETQLAVVTPSRPDLDPIVVGPASEIGEVHAAVELGDAVLVLADGGTFVMRGASWVPSPLAASFDGPIRDAVRLPTSTGRGQGDLWVATEASLYRIVSDDSGDRTERLVLEGDLSELELAVTRRPEGPALWVRLSDRVLEVWRDRTGVIRSANLLLSEHPSAVAGDTSGTGWLVIDSRLHSLGIDRQLVDRGVAVDRLLGDSHTDVVWALSGERAHVVADGELLDAGALDGLSGAGLALGSDGSLFVGGAAGVERLAPRRDAEVSGPPNGALLGSPREFVVIAEGEPEIVAAIDGNPVEVGGEVPTVEVDPAVVGDGSHELVIRLEYGDGTLPIVERRAFEVVTMATWEGDVQPLFAEYCSACHGVDGSAVTPLSTAEDWQSRYDVVLVNVSEGRMPLGRPPLSQREIALVEAWGASGFPQ